jgi:hypothetical protein
MLTYADVCSRMATYLADKVVVYEGKPRMLTYADVCSRMLLTYADVC